MASHDHIPVLLDEVMTWLAPRPGSDFIDATVGRAGHAERILELTAPGGRLLAIDADRKAIDSARASLQAFAGRVFLAESYFDAMKVVAAKYQFAEVAGILFDLGVSSPQLSDPDRGFSFQAAGPLDMRMGSSGPTAAEIVNEADMAELARIFREYGEERYARRIARRVVTERASRPITTTDRLAAVVSRAIPGERSAIHPATRVFQALRIAVNAELDRLESALDDSLTLLARGGRLVVISFHSLEDRIVKQFMRREARDCICGPEVPVCACGHEPRLRVLTRKPVTASSAEVAANPRSRSAKLRVAEAI